MYWDKNMYNPQEVYNPLDIYTDFINHEILSKKELSAAGLFITKDKRKKYLFKKIINKNQFVVLEDSKGFSYVVRCIGNENMKMVSEFNTWIQTEWPKLVSAHEKQNDLLLDTQSVLRSLIYQINQVENIDYHNE